MVYHFIAIVSGYVAGKRIAWHYSSEDKLDKKKIQSFMEEAKEHNLDQFGIHKLSTDSHEWESIVAKDSYFEDVYPTTDESVFFEMLDKEKELKPIDIARLFLSIGTFTQLSIQKLVYLAYADYLCKYKKPMFKENVVAYRYGPVIESLYQEFKKYGKEEIVEEEIYSYRVSKNVLPPLFMKILSTENGMETMHSILSVFFKFKDKTASDLVSLTHSPGSPWSQIYKGDYSNPVIDDKIILEFHKNELEYC